MYRLAPGCILLDIPRHLKIAFAMSMLGFEVSDVAMELRLLPLPQYCRDFVIITQRPMRDRLYKTDCDWRCVCLCE